MTGKEWWHGWDNEQVRGETRQGDAVLLPGVDVRGLSYREEDLKPVTSKKKSGFKGDCGRVWDKSEDGCYEKSRTESEE